MSVYRTTIEIGLVLLEVSIEYQFIPGEEPVDYYPDGSGYPGTLADAEFLNVTVEGWSLGKDTMMRDDSAWWEFADEAAVVEIDREWDYYRELCVKDAEFQNEESF